MVKLTKLNYGRTFIGIIQRGSPTTITNSSKISNKTFIENTFKEENVKYKQLKVFSSPTRLTLFIKDLAEKIKTEAKEIKGPKVGSPHQVIQGFLRAKNVPEKDLIKKETDKGKFYFIKTQSQSILVEDLLIKIIPKAIGSINWKKSMKWSDHNLIWGRPLRAIFAKYNNKKLAFNYEHLDATDEVIIEQDLVTKTKKIKDFKDYLNFLKSNRIIVITRKGKRSFLKRSAYFLNLNNTKRN